MRYGQDKKFGLETFYYKTKSVFRVCLCY